MITREEYNKALDIVEAYHKQVFSHTKEDRATVDEWINKYPRIPVRVYNALRARGDDRKRMFVYMDEVNQRQFMGIRNVGINAWREFVSMKTETPKE